MKKALICGVSGQDGAYLAKLLLSKGYDVYGSSRDAQLSSFVNLGKLGIFDKVKKISMSITDFRSVLQVISKVMPDEIYNLAGQSSVGLSFEQPVETLESIATGTLNLLEAIRFIKKEIRLYNAGSSECFGDTDGEKADEETPFRPKSPYAVAKSTAYWEVSNYRDAYDLYACSGILFNHESPLRPSRFVTKKIINSVCNIGNGSDEKLKLGNIDISRDWGWAPEYTMAMWKMLQLEKPEDFVIATGKSYTLREFIVLAFDEVNLDWKDYVEIDESLFRPSDIRTSISNPEKAENKLNWKATVYLPQIIKKMIGIEQEKYSN